MDKLDQILEALKDVQERLAVVEGRGTSPAAKPAVAQPSTSSAAGDYPGVKELFADVDEVWLTDHKYTGRPESKRMRRGRIVKAIGVPLDENATTLVRLCDEEECIQPAHYSVTTKAVAREFNMARVSRELVALGREFVQQWLLDSIEMVGTHEVVPEPPLGAPGHQFTLPSGRCISLRKAAWWAMSEDDAPPERVFGTCPQSGCINTDHLSLKQPKR